MRFDKFSTEKSFVQMTGYQQKKNKHTIIDMFFRFKYKLEPLKKKSIIIKSSKYPRYDFH